MMIHGMSGAARGLNPPTQSTNSPAGGEPINQYHQVIPSHCRPPPAEYPAGTPSGSSLGSGEEEAPSFLLGVRGGVTRLWPPDPEIRGHQREIPDTAVADKRSEGDMLAWREIQEIPGICEV